MDNLKQIHALTENFSSFQGLKGIPLGLLLMVLSIWASAQTGPGPALYFPVGISVVLIYLYWSVTRFYAQVFGTVVPNHRQKLVNSSVEIGIAAVALLSFWADTSFSHAFSTLGLVFAIAMLVDYRRVAGRSKDTFLLFYPAAALLMVSLSIAPLFDLNWWEPLGIKALLLGICAAAGMCFIILGVITHISFEAQLMQFEEGAGE